jgi:hypothetical protein
VSFQRSVVFAEPVRTAIGAFGGALGDVPASDLGATAIKAADAISNANSSESPPCANARAFRAERSSAPSGSMETSDTAGQRTIDHGCSAGRDHAAYSLDNQRTSKHRVLGFKPQLRLDWRGQDGQSQTKQPDH